MRELELLLLRELELPTELFDEELPLRELDTELLLLRELELPTELFDEELLLLRELELPTELFDEELPLREPDTELLLLRELELPTDTLPRLDTLDTTERLRFSSEWTLTLRLPTSREGTCTKHSLRSRRLCS